MPTTARVYLSIALLNITGIAVALTSYRECHPVLPAPGRRISRGWSRADRGRRFCPVVRAHSKVLGVEAADVDKPADLDLDLVLRLNVGRQGAVLAT
jgi:hypothetical protein